MVCAGGNQEPTRIVVSAQVGAEAAIAADAIAKLSINFFKFFMNPLLQMFKLKRR
jgi:hypothetical protein